MQSSPHQGRGAGAFGPRHKIDAHGKMHACNWAEEAMDSGGGGGSCVVELMMSINVMLVATAAAAA